MWFIVAFILGTEVGIGRKLMLANNTDNKEQHTSFLTPFAFKKY